MLVTQVDKTKLVDSKVSKMQSYGWGPLETTEGDSCSDAMECDNIFGVEPFYIEKGNHMVHRVVLCFIV